MFNYAMRRLLLVIPTLILATVIVFFAVRLIPGNIIDLMISEHMSVSDMDKAKLERALGLDVPVYVQYFRWVGAIILHGDLGNSLWKQTPVVNEIMERFPVTFELGLMALIIAMLIGMPIGVYSAIRQDSMGDYVGRSLSMMIIAIPSFWIGTMVMIFPALWWDWAPPVMLITFTEDPLGNLQMFILPAAIMGMMMAGVIMRMTRTMMLEVLRQDYIRTAWSKGLTERVVIARHAFKNALIPVVTIIGLMLPVVIGGTIILEQIFSLPGMGRLIIYATLQRDYAIVSAVMLLFAVILTFVNLIVDLTYAYLDPRVHYK